MKISFLRKRLSPPTMTVLKEPKTDTISSLHLPLIMWMLNMSFLDPDNNLIYIRSFPNY